MKRYGCVYKSEQSVECLVVEHWKTQHATYSFNLTDPNVLAFHSPEKIAKFMSHFYGGEYLSRRSLDGEYRVIELEPIYILADWRVKGEK